jgi:competence protein ComEA
VSEGRPRAVAAVAAVALAAGVGVYFAWPSSKSALDCPPDQVHLGPDGVARCGPGAPLPAGGRLTVGAPLDLNQASADDLAQLPGVGPQLAKAIVDERTRRGGFKSWDEVDTVPGVGPARMETLKAAVEIR